MGRAAHILAALFLFLLVATVPAAGKNPFTGREDSPPPASRMLSSNTVLTKIASWQLQVRERMAGIIREFRQENKPGPLVFLALLAFVYGSLHAAGPGHGKAVAMAYMVSRRPSLTKGLVFGVSIAMIHGMSGIAFVVIVGSLLKAGVLSALGEVTRLTQMVSYALIAMIGFSIAAKSILVWRSRRRAVSPPTTEEPQRRHWAAALAIGLVPCPGVVMVALFCASMGCFLLGIVLGLAISLGMALTLSTLVLTVTAGKMAAMQGLAGRKRHWPQMETLIAGTGGFLVATFGLLCLTATI